jgi:hypothetical protein
MQDRGKPRGFLEWMTVRKLPLQVKRLAANDDVVFNVAAVITFFLFAHAVFMAIDRGMGVHVEVVLYQGGAQGMTDFAYVGKCFQFYHQLANANKAVFLSAVFYNTCLGMIKLSVLSLYQRILRGVPSQTLPTIVWVLFGLVACNTTANVLVVIFQCWPVKAAWDVTILPEDKR